MDIKFFSLHKINGSKIMMRWFEQMSSDERSTIADQLKAGIAVRKKYDSLPFDTTYCRVVSQVEQDVVFTIGCSTKDDLIEYLSAIRFIIGILKQLIQGELTRHNLSVNFLLVLSVIDRVLGQGEINMSDRDKIIDELRITTEGESNAEENKSSANV